MQNGRIHIQVIGVGGGGGNAVNHIARVNANGAEFISINTDAQALKLVDVPRKLQIGEQLTKGFGSGARPEIGRQAAEEDYTHICELLAGADLVFLTAGLGGGTGTGATPVVAKAAKEMGALTIAIVTLPFSVEGSRRAEVANQGLIELRQIVDTVICIPNDRIPKVAGPNTPLEEAFRMTDEILNKAVVAISSLITRVGIINIDYGDIATVIREPGEAMVGFGEAAGDGHATKAARYAMASPLLQRSDIVGAKQVLLSILAGRDVTMKDVQEALRCVHNEIRGDAHVVFGVITSDELDGTSRVTLIATGLPDLKKLERNRHRPFRALLNPVQDILDFLPAEEGLFVGLEPTLLAGVNYDTPTFVRWGRKLLSDAA